VAQRAIARAAASVPLRHLLEPTGPGHLSLRLTWRRDEPCGEAVNRTQPSHHVVLPCQPLLNKALIEIIVNLAKHARASFVEYTPRTLKDFGLAAFNVNLADVRIRMLLSELVQRDAPYHRLRSTLPLDDRCVSVSRALVRRRKSYRARVRENDLSLNSDVLCKSIQGGVRFNGSGIVRVRLECKHQSPPLGSATAVIAQPGTHIVENRSTLEDLFQY